MSSSMFMVGVTLKLYDQMTSGLQSVTSGMDKLAQRAEKLRHSSMSLMADGMMAGGAMLGPIKAFADLDDAMATLEVAMMQKGGKVGAAFDPLKKQIVELGNKLPGTTADYANLATTMISLGIPAEKLVGGALDAASNLRVVLKMTSEAAGETVVKLREAYNLTDNDLAKTADIAQRAKFAFGMKPEDLRVAASYQSAQLNILHLSGVENMKKMMVMQGMANLKGLDGSSFGTNMGMMLQRLATGPKMLEMAHRGMKGVGKDILGDLGIKFEFFDKKGNFKGLEAMVKEFEKFKIIEKKYGEKGVSEVSNALFGIEAARPAMILAEYGVAGFEAAKKRFEEQAALQERIERYLKTAENVWKAFAGTLTNLMAAFAGPAVEALKPYIDKLNEITGGPLQKFVDEHKTLAKIVGLGLLVFAAAAIGLGVMGLAFAGVLRYVVLVAPIFGAALRVFRVLGPVLSGLGWVVRLLAVAIGKDLLRALLILGRAALANPILALVTLIAMAALLLITRWDKVKEYFGVFWGWLKAGFSTVVTFMGRIGNMLGAVMGLPARLIKAEWQQLKAWFGGFADWFKGKVAALHQALPEWMQKGTLIGGLTDVKGMGPPRPSVAQAGDARVKGEIHIRVDGPARVHSVKSQNPGLKLNAYSGPMMVTP